MYLYEVIMQASDDNFLESLLSVFTDFNGESLIKRNGDIDRTLHNTYDSNMFHASLVYRESSDLQKARQNINFIRKLYYINFTFVHDTFFQKVGTICNHVQLRKENFPINIYLK